MFARRRALLGRLCNVVERLFARFYADTKPGARPGLVVFVQTFGDLVNFNPHIHVLAADGAFDADGGFSVLPPIPRKLLEPSLRKGVLALLRREGLVSDSLAEKMLAWRHTGSRCIAPCALPFSLEKMSYDPQSCTVNYRSRMHKTLKRNFQVMHGADWLVQLCAHIPDRFEHLVRYAGWYSNRSRGKRRRIATQPAEAARREADVREAARALDLDALDSQGVRSRSARMPALQGPDACDRPHRRQGGHPQDPDPPGSVGTAKCGGNRARTTRRASAQASRANPDLPPVPDIA